MRCYNYDYKCNESITRYCNENNEIAKWFSEANKAKLSYLRLLWVRVKHFWQESAAVWVKYMELQLKLQLTDLNYPNNNI